MIIFGGKSNILHNDVWLYNFENREWSMMDTINSEIISPRYGHCATIFGDLLFVFGGYDKSSFVSNELFVLDLNTREWKLVKISVNESNDRELIHRYHAASVLDTNGDWYIFGGKTATNMATDLIKIELDHYNPVDNTCTASILKYNLSEEITRFGHSLILENSNNSKKLVAIGGCNLKVDHFDPISYRITEKQWIIEKNHSLSTVFSNVNTFPVFHTTVKCEIPTNHYRTENIKKLSSSNEMSEFIACEDLLLYKLPKMEEVSFKVVQLGDTGIGKTCLCFGVTSHKFPDEYIPTVYDDRESHLYEIDGSKFKISFWDVVA